MSSKIKWRESFQKARTLSQTSTSESAKRKTSLMEEGDLSLSDDELEQYLGTIKKKSGLSRLWRGNTFDRVIDRTPDVSISSVTDGEATIDEAKNQNEDDDFRPNIMALPSVATEDNNTDISEPSSVKPFQTVNLMSDLELSESPVKLAENVKLTLSRQESGEVVKNEIKSFSNDISNAEEVETLDEISEEIEEDLSKGSNSTAKSSDYSNKERRSHRQKDSQLRQRPEKSKSDESLTHSSQRNSKSRHSKSCSGSRHSRSSTKSKHSSQHTSKHTSHDSSQRHLRTHSRHSKTENSKQLPQERDASSTKTDDSYTTDFSESSKTRETDNSQKSSIHTRSSISSTKVKSISAMNKNTSKQHRINQRYHDVATQVNMDDINRRKLGVGTAVLGPSFGHQYVDPSPIASHVVGADTVEAVTAYNPAVVALTDMIRQQLRLVEQFVENSRRMYESYTNNLNTTYRYTTLEDTLQYIEENRDNERQKQFK